jgi:hypothetical protein
MSDLSGLGDLVLTVGGDISPLEDALSGIPEVASAAAQRIQSAFDAIPSATASVEEGMAALGGAVTEAGAQAAAAGEQLSSMTDGVAEGAAAAAGAIETIPPALHDTTEAASETDDKLKELLESGLELAGIAITMEAVKEAILGSLEAFGELQTATIAMTAMTGDAEAVATAMEGIPALANQIGASIGSLESAFTKFTRYGIDLQQIPIALSSIADAAMGSGIAFDTATAAWERAVNTGNVSAKTIQNMGISLSALATAMGMTGATSAQVTAAFKAIQDSSDGTSASTQRLNDLLRAVPDSVQGMAASAETVQKAFNELSNTVTDVKEKVGAALVTIGNGVVLEGLKDAIDVIGIALMGLVVIVAQFATVAVGSFQVVRDVISQVATVMGDLFKGNFQQAITDLQAGDAKIAADIIATGQKIQDNFSNTGAVVAKIWGDMGDAATAGGAKTKTAAEQANEAFQQLNQTLVNAQNAFNIAAAALANGTGSLSQYETALKNLNTAQENANNGFENFGTAVLIAADAYVKLQIGVANAQTTLKAVVQDIDNGTASATQYSAALVALNKAQMDLNNGYENAHTALLLAIDDFSKLNVQAVNAQTTFQAVAIAAANGQSSLTQLDQALQKLNTAFMNTHGGLQDFQTVVDMVGVSMQKMGVAAQNSEMGLQAWLDKLAAGYPVLQQVIDAMTKAATTYQTAHGGLLDLASATDLLTAAHDKLELAVQNANMMLSAAYALYDKGKISSEELSTYINKLAAAEDALAGVHKNAATAANSATSAIQGLTGAVGGGATAMLNNVNVANDYASSLAIVNGKVVSLGTAYGDTVQAASNMGGSFTILDGVMTTFGANADDTAGAVQSIATAMKNVAAAAPGMAGAMKSVGGVGRGGGGGGGDFGGETGGTNLGDLLNQSMNAQPGSMNMNLSPGDQYTMPQIGNQWMGGSDTLGFGALFPGQTLFAAPETQTFDPQGTPGYQAMLAALQGGTATNWKGQLIDPVTWKPLNDAATALSAAAAVQQTAAQTAYDAAKLATIGANNAITAAQGLTAANDSISASSLAAADAANQTAIAAGALLEAGTNIAVVANTLTSASTSLAGSALALNNAVTKATAPSSSTFSPFAPVVGALPNVGPSGGMTGGLNPGVYTPGYQATVGGTGPSVVNNIQAGVVVGTGGMDQLARMVGDQLIKNLQNQGFTIRRS